MLDNNSSDKIKSVSKSVRDTMTFLFLITFMLITQFSTQYGIIMTRNGPESFQKH